MKEQVTIIGAGIVGICCALSLQERGIPVRLIDRAAPGQATSFGNAGVISPWSFIPQAMPGVWKKIPAMMLDKHRPLSVRKSYWHKMIPWGLRFLMSSDEASARKNADAMQILCSPSIDLYRKHLSGTGHESLIKDSYYVHAYRRAESASLKDLEHRIRSEKGGNLELIDSAQLQQLEPALSHDFKAAVLIKGQARTLSPGHTGQILAQKAIENGAIFVSGDVTKLDQSQDGNWKIETSAETLTAKKLIVAAGVWSANLLEPLGVSVPLVAERGYHVEFPEPGITLEHSVMDVDKKIVASSMLDGLRVAGTAEFATIDAPPDPRRKIMMTEQASAMFPDLKKHDARVWMGQRPSFPDSLPAIGSIKGHSGLYAAFGHSHYGLMMAPKTGELVADMVSDRPSNIDLSPFRLDRF